MSLMIRRTSCVCKSISPYFTIQHPFQHHFSYQNRLKWKSFCFFTSSFSITECKYGGIESYHLFFGLPGDASEPRYTFIEAFPRIPLLHRCCCCQVLSLCDNCLNTEKFHAFFFTELKKKTVSQSPKSKFKLKKKQHTVFCVFFGKKKTPPEKTPTHFGTARPLESWLRIFEVVDVVVRKLEVLELRIWVGICWTYGEID